MISVTRAAREGFREIMNEACLGGEVMRLDREKATVGDADSGPGVYLVAEPEEGDKLIEHGGEPLLWVSVAVSAAYDGCVVDLVETPRGTGFFIGPPEAGRDAR